MKTLALLTAVALLAGLTSARAAEVTTTDQHFVRGAYQSGLANLRLGELAKGKATNADVQAFATRLIADEGKAKAELRTLAQTKGLSVVNGPSTVALGNLRILESQAGTATADGDIRAFITKTLPTLKSQLAAAQALRDKVGR